MLEQMTHRERLLATLVGKETDRPPVSMWRHYFSKEQSAGLLAEAMLAHQRRNDWDFMKVNPRASYHAEPWGLKTRYSGDRVPETESVPVKSARDWAKIDRVRMTHPVFKDQLRTLELIAAGLKGQVPFLVTVFTPVSIAARLTASDDAFMSQFRGNPKLVTPALEAITETFVEFSKAAMDRGASGLFYATTGFATTDRMPRADYRKLVRPWDLKLLGRLPAHEFTLLHVCRDNNMLSEFADYPVHAVNWDVLTAGNLKLAEGQAALKGKAVVGGLGRGGHLMEASPAQIYGSVFGIKSAMGRKGYMIGPACTYDPAVPENNIAAVRMGAEAV